MFFLTQEQTHFTFWTTNTFSEEEMDASKDVFHK